MPIVWELLSQEDKDGIIKKMPKSWKPPKVIKEIESTEEIDQLMRQAKSR